ncbi:MAG: response regulator [Gemmatimonadetes bacterium]|nr:response regulator [Gemmatimonadota bacterium]
MSEDPALHPTPPSPLADFGKVAGELVHDLANDMQVLQGWAALARGEVDRGVLPTEEVQRVSRMAEALGRMLQDVLATVAGQTVSPELAFDPGAVTETAVNDRLTELGLGDIRLRTRMPAGVQVSGRASFWSRTVVNLLRNAARHARSRVVVSLELECAADGRELVMLRVEDDGPGIPVNLRDSVFQPLWRGDHGGAGLGLSSVTWSVDQLNGEVRYAGDSELGGAAFEVRVPTAKALMTREAPEADARALAGLRLLLVDDDPAVRSALSRLLRRAGAEVRELDPLSRPEEHIVEEMVSSLPDGILLDLHLRDRGGVGLWSRLREHVPQLADRVLFISGSAPGDPLWEEANGTGRPVLAKPFQLQQLIALLDGFRSEA